MNRPGFGNDIKTKANKSNQVYQGQSVYIAKESIGNNIQKGDKFYLDGLHKDHIEVFDKRGNFKGVVNLDGSLNQAKSDVGKGRKLGL